MRLALLRSVGSGIPVRLHNTRGPRPSRCSAIESTDPRRAWLRPVGDAFLLPRTCKFSTFTLRQRDSRLSAASLRTKIHNNPNKQMIVLFFLSVQHYFLSICQEPTTTDTPHPLGVLQSSRRAFSPLPYVVVGKWTICSVRGDPACNYYRQIVFSWFNRYDANLGIFSVLLTSYPLKNKVFSHFYYLGFGLVFFYSHQMNSKTCPLYYGKAIPQRKTHPGSQ